MKFLIEDLKAESLEVLHKRKRELEEQSEYYFSEFYKSKCSRCKFVIANCFIHSKNKLFAVEKEIREKRKARTRRATKNINVNQIIHEPILDVKLHEWRQSLDDRRYW